MAFRFCFQLVAVAAPAVLVACHAAPATVPAITSGAATSATSAKRDAHGALLYVAQVHGEGQGERSVVSILSLRSGMTVGEITHVGYVTGACSDASGNVWLPNLQRHRWRIDEFRRGATNPEAQLRPTSPAYIYGCAVDPASGDLAVAGLSNGIGPCVYVWPGARASKPKVYPAPFWPLEAAYDGSGNLYVTGYAGGSDLFFELGELVKGASKVTRITLDESTATPGAVQWDGRYIVVATGKNRVHSRKPRLYRIDVSGSSGNVVGVVRLAELESTPYGFLFALHGKAVIGPAGQRQNHVALWPYPRGGQPIRTIPRLDRINAVAISR